MPGLRGTPAVTMQTSAPAIVLVGVGAGERRVEPADRARLGDVERLALRHALGDVEEHDVAELLQRREMGQRAPDLPGADQRDLRSCHLPLSPVPVRNRLVARPSAAGWQAWNNALRGVKWGFHA